MKIPLSAAIALLVKAYDVVIENYPTTTSLVVEPEGDNFLTVFAADEDDAFEFYFFRELNAEVEVDDEWMTLTAAADELNEASAFRLKLLVTMHLPAALADLNEEDGGIPADAHLHDDPAHDSRIADSEGWCIERGRDGYPEIQRDDTSDVFKNDEEALEFVRGEANRGSPHHRKALTLHEGGGSDA